MSTVHGPHPFEPSTDSASLRPDRPVQRRRICAWEARTRRVGRLRLCYGGGGKNLLRSRRLQNELLDRLTVAGSRTRRRAADISGVIVAVGIQRRLMHKEQVARAEA